MPRKDLNTGFMSLSCFRREKWKVWWLCFVLSSCRDQRGFCLSLANTVSIKKWVLSVYFRGKLLQLWSASAPKGNAMVRCPKLCLCSLWKGIFKLSSQFLSFINISKSFCHCYLVFHVKQKYIPIRKGRVPPLPRVVFAAVVWGRGRYRFDCRDEAKLPVFKIQALRTSRHWIPHLKMAKMATFMLCVFYHPLKSN